MYLVGSTISTHFRHQEQVLAKATRLSQMEELTHSHYVTDLTLNQRTGDLDLGGVEGEGERGHRLETAPYLAKPNPP